MVWLPTAAGRKMPVNAATVRDEDAMFDPLKHTSHFADCPQADTWRNKKPAVPT